MSSQNKVDPFEIRPESGLGGCWPIRWRPGTSVEGGTRFWPSGFRVFPILAIVHLFLYRRLQTSHKKHTSQASRASMSSKVYRRHVTAQSALHKAAKHVLRADQSPATRKQTMLTRASKVRITSSSIYRAMLTENQSTCCNDAQGALGIVCQVVTLPLTVWNIRQLHSHNVRSILPCERAQRAELKHTQSTYPGASCKNFALSV